MSSEGFSRGRGLPAFLSKIMVIVGVLPGVLYIVFMSQVVLAQAGGSSRVLSGVVLTAMDEAVPGVTIVVATPSGDLTTVTNAEGAFAITAFAGTVRLRLSGKNIASVTREIGPGEATANLRLVIEYVIPPIHESMVIVASSLEPAVERCNGEVYSSSLFSRDDQLFDTLAAGINAGRLI